MKRGSCGGRGPVLTGFALAAGLLRPAAGLGGADIVPLAAAADGGAQAGRQDALLDQAGEAAEREDVTVPQAAQRQNGPVVDRHLLRLAAEAPVIIGTGAADGVGGGGQAEPAAPAAMPYGRKSRRCSRAPRNRPCTCRGGGGERRGHLTWRRSWLVSASARAILIRSKGT